MKSNIAAIRIALLAFLATTFLTSCEAIQGIFKAGVWTGIIFVVGIIALVIFIIAKLGKRN